MKTKLILSVLLSILLVSCEFMFVPPVAVESIEFKESSITCAIGEEIVIYPNVYPIDAENQGYWLSSSDESVLRVDYPNVIVGVSEGKAQLTVFAEDETNGSKSDTIEVTVKFIPVDSISFSETIEISVNESKFVSIDTIPYNASIRDFKLVSSNEDILRVWDDQTNITGVSDGTVTLTAISMDTTNGEFGDIIATQQVTVSHTPVESISFTESNLVLSQGRDKYLEINTVPADASYSSFSLSSSDSTVISVSGTSITGVSPGKAIITATSTDFTNGTISTSMEVEIVFIPLEGIEFVVDTGTIDVGKVGYFKHDIKFTPENASNQNIIWSSSNESVMTVYDNGQANGLVAGEAILTATSEEGGFTDTLRIIVSDVNVTGVSLQHTSLDIAKGETHPLSYLIAPYDATHTDVIWSSSNEGVATIDTNGVLTGVYEGNTTITVKTVEGGFSDSMNIRVGASGTTLAAEADTTANDGSTTQWGGQNTIYAGPSDFAYMDFDLTGLNGVTSIGKAYLVIYYSGQNGSVDSDNFRLHKVLESWDEATLHWNNQPAYETDSIIVDENYLQANGGSWLTYDITSFVNSWLGGQADYGLVMESSGNYGNIYIRSRESSNPPQIKVIY